jgi:peroxiredoxin Q/BCP
MIRKFDVAYFAASVDDAEKNRKFAESLELDYPILSDPGKEVAKAYGVLMPVVRVASRHTIYIGADGKILFVDRDVKVGTAGADIAAKLEELGVAVRE